MLARRAALRAVPPDQAAAAEEQVRCPSHATDRWHRRRGRAGRRDGRAPAPEAARLSRRVADVRRWAEWIPPPPLRLGARSALCACRSRGRLDDGDPGRDNIALPWCRRPVLRLVPNTAPLCPTLCPTLHPPTHPSSTRPSSSPYGYAVPGPGPGPGAHRHTRASPPRTTTPRTTTTNRPGARVADDAQPRTRHMADAPDDESDVAIELVHVRSGGRGAGRGSAASLVADRAPRTPAPTSDGDAAASQPPRPAAATAAPLPSSGTALRAGAAAWGAPASGCATSAGATAAVPASASTSASTAAMASSAGAPAPDLGGLSTGVALTRVVAGAEQAIRDARLESMSPRGRRSCARWAVLTELDTLWICAAAITVAVAILLIAYYAAATTGHIQSPSRQQAVLAVAILLLVLVGVNGWVCYRYVRAPCATTQRAVPSDALSAIGMRDWRTLRAAGSAPWPWRRRPAACRPQRRRYGS